MSKKKLVFFGVFVLLAVLLMVCSHWRVQEYYYRYRFDVEHSQKAINTTKEIDSILKGFKTIKYQNLSEDYKKETKSMESQYSRLLAQKTYYIIDRNDFYKFIVGNFRVEDLLAKDKYYRQALTDKSKDYYWLINKSLLYKLLELQKEIERQGYNKYGFGITNGHRHPEYNERVGGAKLSRHIMGEAIDIQVHDIDKNGKYSMKDKDIVLNILEKKIIKEKGGIGRYPGTRAIHFDVRGYRARWDSY